jgi:hypothetical protein
MGVDSGYGSGAPRSAATSASRRRRAASARLRKQNIQRVAASRNIRNAPQDTPFSGNDPFSMTARAVWQTPGRVADVVSGRRTLNSSQRDQLVGVAVAGGLSLAGVAIAGSGRRTSSPTAGARPMTTAERSAAVTRGGRTGVGYIGQSIKPRAPRYDQEGGDYPGIADEPWSSYDSAYARAESIYRAKYGKNVPDQWSEGFAGGNFPSYFDGRRVISPNWAFKTAQLQRRRVKGPR